MDAVVILCGGLTPQGDLNNATKSRIDMALKIESKYYIPSTRFTCNKAPCINSLGFPIDESIVAANYLMNNGIDSKKILCENTSTDTIGNAYFTRTLFTDPRRLKKICIITSAFHMQRTKIIFDWIFSLEPQFDYNLQYIAVENIGLSKKGLIARNDKEQSRSKELIPIINNIKTLEQLHKWIYEEHKAYNLSEPCTSKNPTARKLNPHLLKTY